jgi:hypothetical protein
MTEDEVVREIQRLVAAGEYLDSMLGVPGVRLDGLGTFVGNQREYVRGSPEYPHPSLLHRLYLEVGKGGFGPGYDIFSLPLGKEHKAWRSLATVAPSCMRLGVRHLSFVDCADAEVRMWGWDPNPAPHDDLDKALFREDVSLCQWLAQWVSGEIYQPVLVQDPESGTWRGATREEKAAWMNEP